MCYRRRHIRVGCGASGSERRPCLPFHLIENNLHIFTDTQCSALCPFLPLSNFWSNLRKLLNFELNRIIRRYISLTHQADKLSSAFAHYSTWAFHIQCAHFRQWCRNLLTNLSCGCRAHLWSENQVGIHVAGAPSPFNSNLHRIMAICWGKLGMIEMPTATYSKTYTIESR